MKSALPTSPPRQLRRVLLAVSFSAALHATFLTVDFGSHRRSQGAVLTADDAPLAAILVEPSLPTPVQHHQQAATPVAAAPLSAFSNPVLPAPVQLKSMAQPVSAAFRGSGVISNPRIEAALLQDRDLLGDEIATRQLNEFPAEIDSPVQLGDPILVAYPPDALASGREDTVAVWIVVGADGNADEIKVTSGTDEFASAVVAALAQAHFVPAQNNLRPARYPIALEFRFLLNRGATPAAEVLR